RYVRVVVERGIEQSLSGASDGLAYRAGDEVLEVGDRVEVPLGRGDSPAGGLVVEVGGPELLGAVPAARAKSVLRKSGGRLLPPLLTLARWMSAYYICPLGMV